VGATKVELQIIVYFCIFFGRIVILEIINIKIYKTMFRTNTCGELRISDVNKQVTLSGWVQEEAVRWEGMTFIDFVTRVTE
jgi:aspartyl-tRNA synthetase